MKFKALTQVLCFIQLKRILSINFYVLVLIASISSFTQSNAQINLFDDFESGWGNWNDAGNDVQRLSSTVLSGSWNARLRNGSGSSNTYCDPINLSPYNYVTIEFDFWTRQYDSGEDFFVEFSNDGGTNWSTIGNYVYLTDFVNGTVYSVSITIDNATYSFSNNSVFRIRADANLNGEHVRVDEISIFSSTYCPTNIAVDVEPITNVTFNTIDNTTSENVNGTPALEDFTSTQSTTLNTSTSYTISVEGNTAGGFTNFFTAFIDWNQNGILDDAGEVFPIGSIFNSTGIDGQTASTSITVPGGATIGTTTMRVIKNYNTSPTDPCGTYGYGQAEDYEIVIAAGGTPCTEPTDQPTTLSFTTVTDTQIDGSFTAATSAPDNYLVLYNTDGSTPSISDTSVYNIGDSVGTSTVADNDGDTSFSITGLSSSQTYYFFVYSFNSACSGGPDYLTTSPLTGNATTTSCVPVITIDVEPISNVTFNTIDHTTNPGVNNSPAYEDFTATQSTTLNLTASYTITVEGNTAGAFTNFFTAFIDWNQNGVLDDAGEVFAIGSITNSDGTDGQTASTLITVPGGATIGTTTMRVIKNYNTSPTDPCGTYGYGQAEDYEIVITAGTPCTEPGNQPTGLTFTSVTESQIDGSFTAATSSPDNYLVVYNTDGTTPSISDTTIYNIGDSIGTSTVADNDGNTTFSVTGLAPFQTYYFFVFSYNSSCTGGPDYLTTAPLTGNETTLATSYCNTIDFTNVEPITNVTFNTIDNTTSELTSSPAYEDFTGSISTNLLQAGAYLISVEGNTVGNYTNYFTAFIDWNQNGLLDDAGEVLPIGTITNSDGTDGQTATVLINVPAGAVLGTTRMRIVKNFGSSPTDPCATYTYGQAEDYDLVIQSALPCSEPTAQPAALSFTTINGDSISGTFTAASPAPDNYLVVYNTDGSTPSPVDTTSYNIGDSIGTSTVADNDNNTSFTATGLSTTTTYYFFIFSFNNNCSGGPDYYLPSPLTGNETTLAGTYCTPESVNDESDLYIDHVEFIGTLNDVVNANNGYSSVSPVGFQDWTALPNSIQAQGQGINVFWETGADRGTFKAWVDWDQDFDFEESEVVYYTGGVALSSSTFGFTVPTGQAVGEYRIRLKFYHLDAFNYGDDLTSCEDLDGGNHTYGETEDYTFTVIENCATVITSITEGNECNEQDGDVHVDLTVTGTAGTTEFRWYDAETGGTLVATTPADGSFSSTYSPNLSSTTFFYVTAFNGSCESLYRTRVRATVRDVSTLSFSPSTIEACGESSVVEISVSAVNETVFLIEEYFESGLGSFTLNNVQSNGATEDAATEWQIQSSTFIPALQVWFPAISSGFTGNQFVTATSDYGSSNQVETAIESAVLDTSDFSSLTLTFDLYFSQYFASITEDVNIDVSTNGGTNWTNVQSYGSDVGYGTAFSAETLDLSTYVDEPNFRVRFRYYASDWCDGAALDNIELFGERPVRSTFTWDDGGNNYVNLFTDAGATTPYIFPNFADTVYMQLTPAGLEQATFSLNITADLTNGCQIVENVPVNNLTKTWRGTMVTTDWFDAANWAPNGVPDSSTCVIVPDVGGTPSAVIGPASNTTPAYAYNVVVENGGILNIEENQSLTVTNTVTVEGTGQLNISDTGSLIQIDDVANVGNITMDRITNIRQSDYVFWSSPVASFNIQNVSPSTPNGFKYYWLPTYSRTPIAAGPMDFGTWQAHNTGAMDVGKGYIIRGPSGHSSTPTDYTATFDGVPNNGTITYSIERSTYTGADYSYQAHAGGDWLLVTEDDDNWNLIGNPYPSALNAISFLTLPANSNIEGAVYLWTHGTEISTSNNDPFYDDYVYNYTESDYLAYNSSGTSTPSGFNGNIGAGQGFFVLMNDDATTSETITFNNSMRGNTLNNDQFFRPSDASNSNTAPEVHRIWLDYITPSGATNTTLVAYIAGATDGQDRMFDAINSKGNGLNLYSLINDKPFLIQGRQLPFNDTDTVPIGINLAENGIHTLAINTLEGVFTNDQTDIYIEDLQTGIIHNLKLSPYVFTENAGIVDDRFILRYTDSTLSIDDFDTEANVRVYENNNQLLTINSSTEQIKSVSIYDLLGRTIHANTSVDNTNYVLTSLRPQQQTLLIKVELVSGKEQTLKVIY